MTFDNKRKAFTAWCVFKVMAIPGYILPNAFMSIIEMSLSLHRLKVHIAQ